jgi:hypothetical protein
MSEHPDLYFGDPVGPPRVLYADPTAPHQITLNVESDQSRSARKAGTPACLIGCTCGATRVRQAMEAPIEAMWLAYNTLDHLDRADLEAP